MTKVITLSELVANIRCRRNGKTFLAEFINRCEAQNAVIIPSNATNEDVIRAMFPTAIRTDHFILNSPIGNIIYIRLDGHQEMRVQEDWLNTPYKGVNDESNN